MSKFVPHWNEAPLTEVIDAYTAMKVSVSKIEGLSSELGKFIECGFTTRDVTTAEIPTMRSLVEGGALGHAMECLNVNVSVSGVTRIFTHQLVRQRIGITFSQQCSGEVDWRHAQVLIPRACKEWWEDIVQHSISCKEMYAGMVDSKTISLQEARYILPQTLATHIHFKCSLATLFQLYAKRCCTMSQTWEMVLFCEKLKQGILSNYPELAPMFKENCFYMHSKPEHGMVFPWSTDMEHSGKPNYDSLYLSTHAEMVAYSQLPVGPEYYIGMDLVNAKHFRNMEAQYVHNS